MMALRRVAQSGQHCRPSPAPAQLSCRACCSARHPRAAQGRSRRGCVPAHTGSALCHKLVLRRLHPDLRPRGSHPSARGPILEQGGDPMNVDTFRQMYVTELQELHSVEAQLVDALPKMADVASHPELTQTIQTTWRRPGHNGIAWT